jgi:UDP-glucose 4-epimerase
VVNGAGDLRRTWGDSEAEMSLATVLVTGGAGFIGSHVTAELLRRGHSVRVIDNFSTGSRENLAAVGGEVELVEGDIPAMSTLTPRQKAFTA